MNWLIIYILRIEVVILSTLFIGGIICGVILDKKKINRDARLLYLDALFMRLVRDRIDDTRKFIPRNCLKLNLVMLPLEKIDKQIQSPFWTLFKQRLLYDRLKSQIDKGMFSTNWGETNYAIRAVTLHPKLEYQERVLQFLVHTNTVLSFSAVNCAVKFKTMRAVEAILKAMEEVNIEMQYAYRDALLEADLDIFKILRALFSTTQNQKIKEHAFGILSLKVGYLNDDDILYYLNSENEKLRWTALRAIENHPSKECCDAIYSGFSDPSWKVRVLCAFMVGSIHLDEGIEKLGKAIYDEHVWVQYISALALRTMGQKGEKLLKEQTDHKIASHVLQMPPSFFTKGLRHFFPVNQDPDILFKCYSSSDKIAS